MGEHTGTSGSTTERGLNVPHPHRLGEVHPRVCGEAGETHLKRRLDPGPSTLLCQARREFLVEGDSSQTIELGLGHAELS